MTFVLDNSVALTWCFEDEQTPAVIKLLDRLVEHGAYAPSLWPLEAMNVLITAERRGRLDALKRHRLTGFLRDLPIALDAETSTQVWTATARLAERFHLTVYDASYLELAKRHSLPLATLDKDLRKAGRALGVPLLGS